MTINGYVTRISNQAIIRDSEKKSIQRSVLVLQQRLNEYFGDEVNKYFVFGSYSRGTILPRSMDARSDVDYMIVFDDASFRPQTYLDRLRRFVEGYYRQSIITQANPTIALSLNHIRFELVPAIDSWWHGIRIPAKANSYNDWIETNPTDFNDNLIEANKNNRNMIKPLVRLVKYWNAQNDYVYESYELEQMIVRHGYGGVGGLFSSGQLKDYFFSFMQGLSYGWRTTQWRKNKIDRAHELIEETQRLAKDGYEASAEQAIQRLLPPVTV